MSVTQSVEAFCDIYLCVQSVSVVHNLNVHSYLKYRAINDVYTHAVFTYC